LPFDFCRHNLENDKKGFKQFVAIRYQRMRLHLHFQLHLPQNLFATTYLKEFLMIIRVLLLYIFTFAATAGAQILTWNPLFSTADDTITIVYDATQGNAGLVGATEVYAHTGVITDKSTRPSDWKYVKTNWGQNTPETRLQPLGNNKWKMKYHIRSYYGVPLNEKVLQLAFVFRNANSTREGKTATGGDIFLPIYEKGLNITLVSPTQFPCFVNKDDSLKILAVGAHAAKMSLFIEEQLLFSVENDSLQYSVFAFDYGKQNVKLVALDSSGAEKTFEFYYVVNWPVETAELPSGVQDGINYSDPSQATLVLMAPYKKFVYVIGDFNNWEIDPAYAMKRTPDSSRYWLSLNDLIPGKEYIFQYLVDGSIRIADPYAEKLVDPWNDQYISQQTYPDLLPYPTGKTTEIASVFQTAQSPYQWQATDYQRPEQEDLVIYEMLLRDFLKEHDFKTLTDTLSYFQRLGVNAIELMPFSEFEGNESWGYNPSFYFAPDKYYGRKEDLQRFIDEAHQRGIAVIQDIVLNHSYGASPLVRLYLNEMSRNPWYNVTSPNPAYSWGYDFNHESPATQAFVDRVTSFWLTEYRVDGFRFDFTKGFTNTPGEGTPRDSRRIAILKRMADQIRAVDPTAYIILEHFSDNSEERELADYGMMLWGNMNYNYNEATMGYHSGGKSDFSWASYKARGWSKPNLVAYMESHDQERLMYKNLRWGAFNGDYQVTDTTTALDRVKMAAAFFFTIPGPKMIWQFGEVGYDYSIDYNGRVGNKPIRWDYSQQEDRQSLFDTFAALIKLRGQHPAFRSTDFSLSLYPPVKHININHPSMNVTVIGNFDVMRASVSPGFQHGGKWYDYFSRDSIMVADPQALISMAPGEYHLYTDSKLHVPDIRTPVTDEPIAAPLRYALQQNYPNPFNPTTTIGYSLSQASDVTLEIYNLAGQKVRTLAAQRQSAGEHLVVWNGLSDDGRAAASGVYLYRLRAGEFVETRKMLLVR